MANMTFGVNLIPSSDNTYTLGNSNKKWKLYGNDATTTQAGLMSAADKTALNNAMPKSGGTFTGNVTLNGDPTSDLMAATKQYVDNKSVIPAILNATIKTYLLGTTTAISSTATNISLSGDTGVYLTSNAGELSAKQYSLNSSGTEKVYMVYNNTDQCIDFVFI